MFFKLLPSFQRDHGRQNKGAVTIQVYRQLEGPSVRFIPSYYKSVICRNLSVIKYSGTGHNFPHVVCLVVKLKIENL